MTDDPLKALTRAYAEEYQGHTAVPEATRARVIRTLAEKRSHRRRWWVVSFPLLAILGGSTAWAAANGQLASVITQAKITLGLEEASAPTDSAPPTPNAIRRKGADQPPQEDKNTQTDEAATDEAATLEESSLQIAHEPDKEAESAGLHKASTDAPLHLKQEVKKTNAEPSRTDIQEVELSAYRAGHHAHFVDKNCRSAILAYDAFVKDHPTSSLALEARYNQGVCLFQLGQVEEAKTALLPFAQGQHGGYRREQAQILLDTMKASPAAE